MFLLDNKWRMAFVYVSREEERDDNELVYDGEKVSRF